MKSLTTTRVAPGGARQALVWSCAVLFLLALLAANTAPAQETKTLSVALYKSATVQLDQPAKRVSVGNPGVADIVILRSNEVQVVGKALGATNLVVWDKNGRVITTLNIEVTHDLSTLSEKLHRFLPGETINVHSAQENIVLNGEVKNLGQMQAAIALAESFIPECIEAVTQGEGADKTVSALPGSGQGDCGKGKVVNLMQVGGAQQIMLEIKVAEMARTVLKSMDADVNIFNLGKRGGIGAVEGGANFPNGGGPILSGAGGPVGPNVDLFDPVAPSIDNSGVFLSYLKGDLFLQAVLEISRRKGLAKILSEPTLTTLNGQEAEFLSGGEFPIPVPQGTTNSITIEFKEFGVGVKFLPVVLDSGRINLKLNVSVSELSQDNNVALTPGGTSSAFLIPSLTKRSAKSTVELADGQTIGIAGLISDNTREFVDKLPGLGDIPGLGMLFRSQEFRSGQTELVIFVTPHLARPINPALISLPTDSFVPPSDREFYLMGRMESRDGKAPRRPTQPESSKGGTEGARFGHEL
jgi:pilus assembly protein CpaC